MRGVKPTNNTQLPKHLTTRHHQKTIISLCAPPGGGKGTTEKGLKGHKIPFRELPFRELLDREVVGKTEIGEIIQRHRSAGLLVPNETVLPIVDEALDKVAECNLVLSDGFPRNIVQVNFALERFRHHGFERVIALAIDTPDFTCVQRLAGRGRDALDLDPKKIGDRLRVYHLETVPMILHMRIHADELGIKFFLIDGQNLMANMDDYIRMLDIGWMAQH